MKFRENLKSKSSLVPNLTFKNKTAQENWTKSVIKLFGKVDFELPNLLDYITWFWKLLPEYIVKNFWENKCSLLNLVYISWNLYIFLKYWHL